MGSSQCEPTDYAGSRVAKAEVYLRTFRDAATVKCHYKAWKTLARQQLDSKTVNARN